MKKIEYITPEMEVIELSVQRAVLQAVSGGGEAPVSGGSADPNDPDDLP